VLFRSGTLSESLERGAIAKADKIAKEKATVLLDMSIGHR